MRFLFLVLAAMIAVQFVGCGGGGSSHRLEQTFPLEQAPTAGNDAGVAVKITYYKQSDHYLIVRASITNNGKDPVVFKNSDGATLAGFRATIEGQTFLADRRPGGYWNPWTGYVQRTGSDAATDLSLPPGVTTSIELRWNFQLSRKDFPWTTTFSNMQVGDKKLADISISYPAAGLAPAK